MNNRTIDQYTANEERQGITAILDELQAIRECLTAIAEKLDAIPEKPIPEQARTAFNEKLCGDDNCRDDDCRGCPWVELSQ